MKEKNQSCQNVSSKESEEKEEREKETRKRMEEESWSVRVDGSKRGRDGKERKMVGKI